MVEREPAWLCSRPCRVDRQITCWCATGVTPDSLVATLSRPSSCVIVPAVIVYAVVDDALSPDFPLGVELEVFVRREDAERFIEEVRGDDSELAAKLRIEERELRRAGRFPLCPGGGEGSVSRRPKSDVGRPAAGKVGRC